MDDTPPQSTPFGPADLSNCELDQIQFAGSIQPHGVLLVVEEPDYRIVQASANAASVLGFEKILGKSVVSLGGDLLKKTKVYLAGTGRIVPVAFRCEAGTKGGHFNALVHRIHEEAFILELEKPSPILDLNPKIEAAISSFVSARSLEHLCGEATKHIRKLTG